jgi:hypothetical protein
MKSFAEHRFAFDVKHSHGAVKERFRSGFNRKCARHRGTADDTSAREGRKMTKVIKSTVLAVAMVASTFAGGLTQSAEARNYYDPYGFNGYNTNFVNPNYNPYNGGAYYRRPSIIKPTLVGAAIGGAGGLGVSLLSGRDKHYVRNIGIGAGIAAGVGAGIGLIRRHNFNKNFNNFNGYYY